MSGNLSITFYNFVLDWLPQLRHIPKHIFEQSSNYRILLRDGSPYFVQWLKIVIPELNRFNVSTEKIVGCDHLYSVKSSWTQGVPTANDFEGIYFLRDRINNLERIKRVKRRNLLVLMKRNSGDRSVSNHDELEQLCREYAEKNKLVVSIHDDENLPGVIEQLKYFSRAVCIVGPHGAGLTNILACKPYTYVIEAKYPRSMKCYKNLCRALSLNYACLILKRDTQEINLQEVTEMLPTQEELKKIKNKL